MTCRRSGSSRLNSVSWNSGLFRSRRTRLLRAGTGGPGAPGLRGLPRVLGVLGVLGARESGRLRRQIVEIGLGGRRRGGPGHASDNRPAVGLSQRPELSLRHHRDSGQQQAAVGLVPHREHLARIALAKRDLAALAAALVLAALARGPQVFAPLHAGMLSRRQECTTAL